MSSARQPSARALLLIVPFLFLAAQAQPPARADLQPHVSPGQLFGNVFSRAIAIKAQGYEDVVRRMSGTGIYKVLDTSAAGISFDSRFLYDGRPEDRGKTEIKDNGRTICYNGKCSPATDASGISYNPLLWGDPHHSLRPGLQWQVSIAAPWELGPAGTETVTVQFIDPANHIVALQREGSGDGFFEGDTKQVHLTKDGKTYLADLTPARAHWLGSTVFRNGIILSDELTVERNVTLSSQEIGAVAGSEREYVLLNAMPVTAF